MNTSMAYIPFFFKFRSMQTHKKKHDIRTKCLLYVTLHIIIISDYLICKKNNADRHIVILSGIYEDYSYIFTL